MKRRPFTVYVFDSFVSAYSENTEDVSSVTSFETIEEARANVDDFNNHKAQPGERAAVVDFYCLPDAIGTMRHVEVYP